VSTMPERVIWHDVECGGYDADMALWLSLCAGIRTPVLELGAGTGRVALRLGRNGHHVVAVERDPQLAEVLHTRAGDLPVDVMCADVTTMRLSATYELVIAPMQLVQVLEGQRGRERMFETAAAVLRQRGRFAVAFAENVRAMTFGPGNAPEADVVVRNGLTYMSVPVAVTCGGKRIEVVRQRQVLQAAGVVRQALHRDQLYAVTREALAHEARSAGLTVAETRAVTSGGVEYVALVFRRSRRS